MVIYEREIKKLIIPLSTSMPVGSAPAPCDCTEEVAQAYANGYRQGQEDCPECPGGTCNLQDKEVSIQNGDSGQWIFTPDNGYSGMSSIVITDEGYGQGKYNEGYADGQESCTGGTCVLEEKTYTLPADWDGSTTILPTTADGFSQVTIEDGQNGYGTAKYNEGFTDGTQEISGNSISMSVNANGVYSADTANGVYIRQVNVNVEPTVVSLTYAEYEALAASGLVVSTTFYVIKCDD